ncbi:lysophospholipid acyltransferase family protein [Mucilaginibacter xinganensis]|uniref:2-acyl-glycerophospho-ethanolamine acyltransferase n=1 Tax=Mucilaginibacter xinganensis TaxID=1234841 RepID=A0A223NVA4_9SPHI|nr:lysophospholipid acyltransferase family protein [Mucilaginibacter xinganensis]ASU33805.1 2-acyl-glycerophospho-ethanolamine acyltransferase [Mucilaginibacter xinganensis]
MKLIVKRIHTYFYRYSVAFFFLLVWPVLYFLSRNRTRYRYINGLRRFIIFCSTAISGIFFNVDYEAPVDWKRTYIICGNHTSNLDVSAINLAVKNNHCFIGKEELLSNLVLGFFFRTIDITVNRESKISSFKAFKKAAERVKDGVSVVIFPEATIPEVYPPELYPFKSGAFRLAIELKVPVIPVTSINTWKVLWDTGSEYGSRPGICDIFVHKPIETAHLTIDDADGLRDEVHGIIKKKLERA